MSSLLRFLLGQWCIWSPSRSTGLSPEHHLQSVVWVKGAQQNTSEGKYSTQEPTVGGEKACMAHCPAKTKPQPGLMPDTTVSLGGRWGKRDTDGEKAKCWGLIIKNKNLKHPGNSQTTLFEMSPAGKGERLFVAGGRELFTELGNGCICADACNYFTSSSHY